MKLPRNIKGPPRIAGRVESPMKLELLTNDGMVVDHVIASLQLEENILADLLHLPFDRLKRVLQSLPKASLVQLLRLASTRQLRLLKCALHSENTAVVHEALIVDIDYDGDPEEDVPGHIFERLESSELFANKVSSMMHACGDAPEPLEASALILKDSLGIWMRQVVSLLPPKSFEPALSQMFATKWAPFKRWYDARCDGETMDEEDLEELEEEMAQRIISDPKHEESPPVIVKPTGDVKIPVLDITIGNNRLESHSQRTLGMTALEYEHYSMCRSTSFLKRDTISFCTWIGVPRRSSKQLGKVVLSFLCYLVWDRVGSIMEVAASIRSHHTTEEVDSPYLFTEVKHAIRIVDQYLPVPAPVIVPPRPKVPAKSSKAKVSKVKKAPTKKSNVKDTKTKSPNKATYGTSAKTRRPSTRTSPRKKAK